MFIAYTIHDGISLVASIAPGVAPEQAAQAIGLAPGTWRVITAEEAAELQKPVIKEVRAAKLAEIMGVYQAAFAEMDAVYPQPEREGWPVQEAEAKTILENPHADPATAAPVLSLLVQLRARNENVHDLATKVLNNAGQWRMLYAFLTGQQQRMYADVLALPTIEAIQAYTVHYQLPEGM